MTAILKPTGRVSVGKLTEPFVPSIGFRQGYGLFVSAQMQMFLQDEPLEEPTPTECALDTFEVGNYPTYAELIGALPDSSSVPWWEIHRLLDPYRWKPEGGPLLSDGCDNVFPHGDFAISLYYYVEPIAPEQREWRICRLGERGGVLRPRSKVYANATVAALV